MRFNPQNWFSNKLRPLEAVVVKKMASYVDANDTDIVLVENASSGVNAVLRSLNFQEGDKIVRLNVEYPMTKNTIDFVASRFVKFFFFFQN